MKAASPCHFLVAAVRVVSVARLRASVLRLSLPAQTHPAPAAGAPPNDDVWVEAVAFEVVVGDGLRPQLIGDGPVEAIDDLQPRVIEHRLHVDVHFIPQLLSKFVAALKDL